MNEAKPEKPSQSEKRKKEGIVDVRCSISEENGDIHKSKPKPTEANSQDTFYR